MAEYFNAGKLVAAHGLKGEILFKHELGEKPKLKQLQTIFVEDLKGSFLPYFVEASKLKIAGEILLKIEGIETREQALKIIGKQIWLPEDNFKKIADKSAPANLLGYSIIDEGKNLGEILELIEQPHQLLCKLIIDKKEVLIPLHEESLQKINHKTKQVFVELPEGLLDIYLG